MKVSRAWSILTFVIAAHPLALGQGEEVVAVAAAAAVLESMAHPGVRVEEPAL